MMKFRDCTILLVGLSGKAGSGKDYICGQAFQMLGPDRSLICTRMAFADALKNGCAAIFNIPREWLDDRDVKEQTIEEWGLSPRQMAQLLGTEACRNTFGPDIWIKSVASRLRNNISNNSHVLNEHFHGAPKNIVCFITDVRFDNEANWIRENGGLLYRVVNPNQQEIKNSGHVSEHGITNTDGMTELKNVVENRHSMLKILDQIRQDIKTKFADGHSTSVTSEVAA